MLLTVDLFVYTRALTETSILKGERYIISNPPLHLFVQLMPTNVRNSFLEPLASTGETGRRELLIISKPTIISGYD
jgi:hypothetical protein